MKDEQLFLTLVRLFKHIGYGRMMQIISHEWYRHDPHGALSVGNCYGLLPDTERWIWEDIAKGDALFEEPS